MTQIVEQLSTELKIDCDEEIEKEERDSCDRKMQETKLSQLLSELLDTERKYVQDLEQVISFVLSWVFHLCVPGL